MTFVISGSIRSKKNSKQIIKAKGRHIPIPSDAYALWEKQAHQELAITLREMNLLLIPFSGSVKIKATFYYKGSRPDLSGAEESLGDCLEGFIINNDRQIESWDGSRMVHDKDNPRTEFEITSY